MSIIEKDNYSTVNAKSIRRVKDTDNGGEVNLPNFKVDLNKSSEEILKDFKNNFN
jgi:hypothetical protein